LPEWIPEEAWKGWLELRLKKHVPNTDRAMRLAVVKLETLKTAGEDLAAVIDQSTVSGWTKFYTVSIDRAKQGAAQREQPACGNCSKPITGAWSQSPKGRVCDPCWKVYHQEGKWK
jgi:hypothetical protein